MDRSPTSVRVPIIQLTERRVFFIHEETSRKPAGLYIPGGTMEWGVDASIEDAARREIAAEVGTEDVQPLSGWNLWDYDFEKTFDEQRNKYVPKLVWDETRACWDVVITHCTIVLPMRPGPTFTFAPRNPRVKNGVWLSEAEIARGVWQGLYISGRPPRARLSKHQKIALWAIERFGRARRAKS